MQAFAAKVEGTALPLKKSHDQPIKISAVYPGKQRSDYWRRTMRALSLRLDLLGLNYQFMEQTYAFNASMEQQKHAINEALLADPDYLILTLDEPRQQRMIEQLLMRQRPKIILLNITTPVKNWASHQPLLYSGFDHILGTKLLADELLNPTREPQSIGLLYRQPGYVSTMRGGSFADLVRERGGTLSASYYTKSDVETSHLAALRLLEQHPNLSIIFACATDVALGAIQAIGEKGLKGRVIVNGWGGGQAELDAIRRKEMALTVMRMNDDAAVAVAEAICNDQTGLPVPQIYSGRMVLVTQQHSAEQIQQLSNTAFRYSNP
ncbi:MAG: substrate-binding domain-containing protein [Motiliproteus sp.]